MGGKINEEQIIQNIDETLEEIDDTLEEIQDTIYNDSLKVRIEEDNMQAYLSGIEPSHCLDQLVSFLEKNGVIYGIQEENIAVALEKKKNGELLEDEILVASACDIENEVDRIEFFFKPDLDPGTLHDNDSIDFRERDAIPNVKEGEMLARIKIESELHSKKNVKGEEIQSETPIDINLKAGINVILEETEDGKIFRAEIDGCAKISKDVISVLPKLVHNANVDYRIGNIRFDGDIEIHGNICSRFIVEATRDLVVYGCVERGASISSGGNLVVRGGLTGATAESGADCWLPFVSRSRVKVSGELNVKSYIHDSDIIAESIKIEGNGEGDHAALVGGEVKFAKDLVTPSLGNKNFKLTIIRSGFEPELEKRLANYRQGIEFCRMRSRQAGLLLESIVGGDTSAYKMKQAILNSGPGKRKILLERLAEISKLKKLRQSLDHYIEQTTEERTKFIEQAQIKVKGALYPHVDLHFGDETLRVDQIKRLVQIRVDDDGKISCS